MFQKIVIVEPVSLTEAGKEELKKYCKELVVFNEVSTGEEETIRRIGNADCILISTFTVISKEIIEKANYLKHVVLCGSYYGKQFAKIDIDVLEQNHITYSHLAEFWAWEIWVEKLPRRLRYLAQRFTTIVKPEKKY